MRSKTRARLTRGAAVTLVAFGLAASMALGIAAPAQAAAAYPDGWSPKRFITHMLSSVMAAVGNTPAKRALIANSQKYDHSYEGLDELLKQKARNGTPDSFADYVIDKQKYFDDNNMTSKQGDISGKKIVQRASVPAAALTALGGVAVTGGTVVTAGIASAYFGMQIGKGVSQMMGLDVEGGICAPAGGGGEFVSFITGTDCSSFLSPDLSVFKANADMQGLAPGGACDNLATIDNGFLYYNSPAPGQYQWKVACRSLGEYVNRYPNPSRSLDGWYKFETVTENANKSLTVTWSYSGPAFTDTYNQYTAPSITGQCVVDGVIKAGFGIQGFNRLYNHTNSGTYTTEAPNCGAGGRIWILGGGLDASREFNGRWGVVYSPGESLNAVQSQDPSRTVQCSIVGSDGNTYTENSLPFTLNSGKMAPAKCPVLPDGVYGKSTKADLIGGAGPQPLYNQPTTDAYQNWAVQYPECVDGACPLLLIDKRQAPSVSCFDSASTSEACASWMADPNKNTNYQCTYGSHDVAISECYVYGDTFKPDKIAAGQAYSDPATGLSVPGQSSPGSAATSLGKTFTDPSNFQGCLSTGWAAANPVEWVLMPIQCGMQWAFAPREAVVQGSLLKLSTGWASTGVGKLSTAVSAWKINPSVSGCSSSLPFPVPMIGKTITVPIIQACPGTPMGDFAPWVRGLVSASLAITAAFAVKRIVSGWIPS